MSGRDTAGRVVDVLVAEPALVRGVVASVVALLAALGLAIGDNGAAATTALLLAVLPLLQAILTRAKVTPVGEHPPPE